MSGVSQSPHSPGPGWFPTTRWSVVQATQQDEAAAAAALETLCRAWWKPVFTFIRASGFSQEDAQDHTQEFLAHITGPQILASVCREKGKLRTFLLVSLRHFLSNARERAGAQKRGGGWQRLDGDTAESELLLLASPDESPDRLFDRHWAHTLLQRVFDRLAAEYGKSGRSDVFHALRPALAGATGPDGAAESLGMSDGAVRVALHRLRRRYHDLLLEEVMHTLGEESPAEEELRALLAKV